MLELVNDNHGTVATGTSMSQYHGKGSSLHMWGDDPLPYHDGLG